MTEVWTGRRSYTAVVVVPTGIGAAVGGYAGDALPLARAVAAVADTVITHPNVMNGAQLYWPMVNTLYVEGFGLDQFAAGRWGLRPVHHNRVGIVLDQAIEADLRWRHLQAAEATRATLGLDLTDYVVTDQSLGVELRRAASGATWGTIEHPDSLLRAGERLLRAGATAIAVIARFPDESDEDALQNYRHGQGVDPLAGAEAVISHLVVRTFQRPCAHAPALLPLPLDPTISPKSAAEEIGYTFLPCVLAGLSKAPQFVTTAPSQATDIWADRVDALLVPASACGGSATLSFSRTNTLIIAVQDNTTTLNVPPEALGIPAVQTTSYLEALGIMAAHKAGIHARSLGATVPKLQELEGK